MLCGRRKNGNFIRVASANKHTKFACFFCDIQRKMFDKLIVARQFIVVVQVCVVKLMQFCCACKKLCFVSLTGSVAHK